MPDWKNIVRAAQAALQLIRHDTPASAPGIIRSTSEAALLVRDEHSGLGEYLGVSVLFYGVLSSEASLWKFHTLLQDAHVLTSLSQVLL